MAEAGGVTLHTRIKDLRGLLLCNGAGDDACARARAVQNHVHLAHGMLIACCQEFFVDLHLGICAVGLALRIALRVVDAADLAGVHDDGCALLQIDDGLRVQNALAGAFALAVVLLNIVHLRVFADVESVDTVVLGVAVAAVMDAAAGHDRHVRALADKEVVIDHVVEPGFAQNDGDMHVFTFGKRCDFDVNAVLVGLGDNLDMLRVLAECLLTVKTDVDRAVRNARHIRDGLENAFLNVVQHVPFTSSRLQPATVCDSSFG